MRIPSGKIPNNPLKYMWERHHEIKRRLVAGQRPIDIARDLNFSPSRISVIMRSPTFKEELLRLRKEADEEAKDIRRRISKLAIDSMSILENAIRDENNELSTAAKIKVAMDVLDRAGFSPVNKNMNLDVVVTPDDIEELKRRRDNGKG